MIIIEFLSHVVEDIRLSLIASGLYDYCLKVLRETEEDDGMVREFLGTLNALLLTRMLRMDVVTFPLLNSLGTAFTDFICKHEAIPLLITLLEKATEVELIAEIIDMMTPWAETGTSDCDSMSGLYLSGVAVILPGAGSSATHLQAVPGQCEGRAH